jgi:hypothetical protein
MPAIRTRFAASFGTLDAHIVASTVLGLDRRKKLEEYTTCIEFR